MILKIAHILRHHFHLHSRRQALSTSFPCCLPQGIMLAEHLTAELEVMQGLQLPFQIQDHTCCHDMGIVLCHFLQSLLQVCTSTCTTGADRLRCTHEMQ